MKRVFLHFCLLFVLGAPAVAGEADVPYTSESIDKGRALYASLCTECHGRDGKSLVDVISDATDLTEPDLYRNGTSDAAIDQSIRDGAGSGMPPFGSRLKGEDDVGHLRNFIKSLWPEARRPTVAN
jgi:mono/diheme cytochrome c family protein